MSDQKCFDESDPHASLLNMSHGNSVRLKPQRHLKRGTRSAQWNLPERERVAPKLFIGAAHVHVLSSLAQGNRHMVAEAVTIHIAPLALHNVGQALGAKPQQRLALLQRCRL